jgi:hypothetical protein
MTTYNKQVALALCNDLIDTAKTIAAASRQGQKKGGSLTIPTNVWVVSFPMRLAITPDDVEGTSDDVIDIIVRAPSWTRRASEPGGPAVLRAQVRVVLVGWRHRRASRSRLEEGV